MCVRACVLMSWCNVLDHSGYMCVNDDVGVNMKSAAKHRLYLKENRKAHGRSLYFEMN